jgi:hypothetical protein
MTGIPPGRESARTFDRSGQPCSLAHPSDVFTKRRGSGSFETTHVLRVRYRANKVPITISDHHVLDVVKA